MDQQINYQFTGVPPKLMYCLDNNCKSMLFALIDLSGIHSNEDGWFYRSNKELQLDTDLSENLVRVVLDTLYQAGIINVFSNGRGKRQTNRIHVNFESFRKYEQYTFNDTRNNKDLKIRTLKYKGSDYSPSYLNPKRTPQQIPQETPQQIPQKVSTILDTLNTLNTLENNIIYNEEIPQKVSTCSEKNPCTKEELGMIYRKNFEELMSSYPTLNYGLLMVNQDTSFYECYVDIVNELVIKVSMESQREITKDNVLKTLCSYLKHIQYAYQ